MGFLDRAKQAANDFAAQMDTTFSGQQPAQNPEKLFRDLGMLTYLQRTDREVDQADVDRLMQGLLTVEQSGHALSFAQVTKGPPPPGAGGPASAPPPPPGGATTPPPPPSAEAAPSQSTGAAAPPPPTADAGASTEAAPDPGTHGTDTGTGGRDDAAPPPPPPPSWA